MDKQLKTITLESYGGPSLVVCPGHVDQKTFNQAHKNEGWSPGGGYRQKDFSYVYGYFNKKKVFKWRNCHPKTANAKPYTMVPWD